METRSVVRGVRLSADKGRLVQRELKTPLLFTATVDANGMQIDLQIETNETRTFRLHADKPLP